MSTIRIKKRSCRDEHRNFNSSWTYNFFFTEVNGKAVCLVCHRSVAVMKKCNVERHYITKHKDMISLTGEARTFKIRSLKQSLEQLQQQEIMKKPRIEDEDVLVSTAATEFIAKRPKLHSEEEFIEKCLATANNLIPKESAIMSSGELQTAGDLELGMIPDGHTAMFMCDIQDKFRPAMLHFDHIVENAKKMVECSKVLEIPLFVTEQYPKGLGNTVPELDIMHASGVFAKTKFSMDIEDLQDAVASHFNGQLKCVILFGIEAHVCVEQTAMDLLKRGVKVHIVADASTSRSQEDRLLAFERMKQMGCFITTSENVFFKLLKDKDHPKFNELRSLVKNPSPATGLVSRM